MVEDIISMNQSIHHRGPDDNGTSYDVIENFGIAFGQARLAIIDLSRAGHQPMFYDRKSGASNENFHYSSTYDLSLVFNGEIYNHLDIRKELEDIGYIFSTKSDTEVILASYLAWWPDCVTRFNGMWAFCIYDKIQHNFFCSRDRFGKKPLYFYHTDTDFIFSSELKGILAHTDLHINTTDNIDADAVDFYFSMGNIPAPLTIYKNISKLEAWHNILLTLEQWKLVLKKSQYYTLPSYSPLLDRRLLIEEGRSLLDNATKIRMFSADVPVWAFLSGGLDSSSVVAMMTKYTEKSKLHTFSIGFEGKYDETKYIDIVKEAFWTNHHHKYFCEDDFCDMLDIFAHTYDEPFADVSGFPTLFVSKLAREHVTVSLSGDGWDEIFGWYMMHQVAAQMDILYKTPILIRKLFFWIIHPISQYSFFLMKVSEALRLSFLPKYDFYAEISGWVNYKSQSYKDWTRENMQKLLEQNAWDFTQSMIDFDLMYNTLADNFLTKVDRASMAYALEVRSPFLDYRFIEYSRKIPVKWKVTPFKTKILMRDIIRDIVPDSILQRWKQWFAPPIVDWIMQDSYIQAAQGWLKIIRSIKAIHPELISFLSEIFEKKNQAYPPEYVIRLFLFYRWHKQWID